MICFTFGGVGGRYPHRFFDQIEHSVQIIGRLSGRQPGDQPVEYQIEVTHQHLGGHVVTQPTRRTAALESSEGGLLQIGGVRHPRIPKALVRPQLPGDLESGAEPVEILRTRQHVAHDLNETGLGYDVGHFLGILGRQRQEECFLVPEVMKDRTSGQAGGCFYAFDRRPVVAVFGEAMPRAVENLPTTRGQPVITDLGQLLVPSLSC